MCFEGLTFFVGMQAAATSCYVATNPQLNGVCGKFFMDCNEAEPGQAAACDMQLAASYWKFSEELINSKSTDNHVTKPPE